MRLAERYRRSLLTEEYAALGLPSPVEGHLELHRRAERSTTPLIDLSIMTDQTPPAEVRLTAARQALDGGYVKNALPVRQRLARYYREERGVAVDPEEEIFLTAGSQLALDSALKLLVEAGDEVVVGEPEYATYEPMVRFYGGRVRGVPLSTDGERWRFDVDAFGRAVTAGTRLVILSNPNNPVGTVYDRDELAAIARIAERAGAWVISDEIWSTLVLDERRPFVSLGVFDAIRERLVILFSASKTFGMSGYRTGALIANAEFIRAVDQVVRFTVQAAPTIGQLALERALDPAATGEWLAARKQVLRERADAVVERLRGVDGVRCARPESGVFLFPDVSARGQSSLDFALGLLESKGVYVLPGYFYGRHCDAHVRVSLSVGADDLEEGVARIVDYLGERE